MTRCRFTAWIVALCSVLALAPLPARALDTVVLGTDWLPDGERGGYYQALATGIYQKHGLEVTIVAGGPQVNNAMLLASGRLDVMMMSSANQVFSFAQSDIPLVAVAAFYQKNPQILMAHQSQGYQSLADLKGKPIMISTLARVGYWAWLKSTYGYTDDQIRPYTFNIAPYLNSPTAIQQGYATYEPYEVAAKGADPKVFLLADAGYADFAAVAVVRRDMIETRHDVLQRFIDASIEGWYSVLYGDPAPAIALIKSRNPDISEEIILRSLKGLRDFAIIDTGDAKQLGIGAMTDARWTQIHDQFATAGIAKLGDDWRKSYSLDFIGRKVGMAK